MIETACPADFQTGSFYADSPETEICHSQETEIPLLLMQTGETERFIQPDL